MKFVFNIHPDRPVELSQPFPPEFTELSPDDSKQAMISSFGVEDGNMLAKMLVSDSYRNSLFNLVRGIQPVLDEAVPEESLTRVFARINPGLIEYRYAQADAFTRTYHRMLEYLKAAPISRRHEIEMQADKGFPSYPEADAAALRLLHAQGMFSVLDKADPEAAKMGVMKRVGHINKQLMISSLQKMKFAVKRVQSRVDEMISPAARMWETSKEDYTTEFKLTSGKKVSVPVRTIRLGPKALRDLIPSAEKEGRKLSDLMKILKTMDDPKLQIKTVHERYPKTEPEDMNDFIMDKPKPQELPYPEPDFIRTVLEGKGWRSEVKTVIEQMEKIGTELMKEAQEKGLDSVWPMLAGIIGAIFWDGLFRMASVIGDDTVAYCKTALKQFEKIPVS